MSVHLHRDIAGSGQASTWLLHIQGLSHTKESEKCPFKHPELLLIPLIAPQGQSSPHAGWNEEQCCVEGTNQL